MWQIFIVFLYRPDDDLNQGRNIVALANIFYIYLEYSCVWRFPILYNVIYDTQRDGPKWF
jgi:hypothetical protein